MGHILSLFTYLLTTSVSDRVPGYPSYYPTGTRVINYPDTAALITRSRERLLLCVFTWWRHDHVITLHFRGVHIHAPDNIPSVLYIAPANNLQNDCILPIWTDCFRPDILCGGLYSCVLCRGSKTLVSLRSIVLLAHKSRDRAAIEDDKFQRLVTACRC